jgi:hypothetical protein
MRIVSSIKCKRAKGPCSVEPFTKRQSPSLPFIFNINGREGDHVFLKGSTEQGPFALLHLIEETLCISNTPRTTVRECKVVPELN